MPDFDLEPHEYGRRDTRTGTMVRALSPKWARNWFLVCIAALIWVFWNRAGFTVDILFGVSAFWAFGAGVMAANWLKNVY